MIELKNSLAAWASPDFERVFKEEVQKMDTVLLPLQQGLSQSSQVSDSEISVVILGMAETLHTVRVKAGIFYTGVIAGSCCADDPTPMSEQNEYCELQFDIDKRTAGASVIILREEPS